MIWLIRLLMREAEPFAGTDTPASDLHQRRHTDDKIASMQVIVVLSVSNSGAQNLCDVNSGCAR